MMHVLVDVFTRHSGEELDLAKVLIRNLDSVGMWSNDGRNFI